jgi:hypothetical protein
MLNRRTVQAQAAQAIRASSVALGERCAQAHQHSAELIVAARDLCHTGRVLRAWERTQRARRDGEPVAAPAWFAVVGLVDGQVVHAVVDGGRLVCDEPLEARAWLLVDLGEQFVSDDPPCWFRASLQAPLIAVALTLVRACDRVMQLEFDLGQLSPG